MIEFLNRGELTREVLKPHPFEIKDRVGIPDNSSLQSLRHYCFQASSFVLNVNELEISDIFSHVVDQLPHSLFFILPVRSLTSLGSSCFGFIRYQYKYATWK